MDMGGPARLFVNIDVLLTTDLKSYSRKVYGPLNLIGDYGGVEYVLIMVFTVFLAPLSEHSFLMKAIRKLYWVKTDQISFEMPQSNKARKNEKKHRKI